MTDDFTLAIEVTAAAIGGGVVVGVTCWVASLVGLYLFERGETHDQDS